MQFLNCRPICRYLTFPANWYLCQFSRTYYPVVSWKTFCLMKLISFSFRSKCRSLPGPIWSLRCPWGWAKSPYFVPLKQRLKMRAGALLDHAGLSRNIWNSHCDSPCNPPVAEVSDTFSAISDWLYLYPSASASWFCTSSSLVHPTPNSVNPPWFAGQFISHQVISYFY